MLYITHANFQFWLYMQISYDIKRAHLIQFTVFIFRLISHQPLSIEYFS